MNMRIANVAALALVASAGLSSSAFAQVRGASTSVNPYVLPVAPGVTTVSILTVGESVNNNPSGSPYRLVGIPDGMGAFNLNANNFSLLVAHEIGSTSGITRAHGGTGAFVSQWTINRSTSGIDAFRVTNGQDAVQSNNDVSLYNSTTGTYFTPAANDPSNRFNRFCSADLSPATGLYNPLTGNGTQERLFLTGEEAGVEGRAFALTVGNGGPNTITQLPALGRTSWENALVNPFQNHDRTIVMSMNDGAAGGYTYMYVGNRTNTGSAVERAGLTNGTNYALTVSVNGNAVTSESNAFALGTNSLVTSGRFGYASLGNVTNLTGAQINAAAQTAGAFGMQRQEDGAWDTRTGFERDFYFVTTASVTGESRLWRQRFDDITNPTAGGQIDMLWQSSYALNGPAGIAGTSSTESPNGVRMMDNICMDTHGRIFIVEDVGNNAILGRVLMFDTNTNTMSVLAQFDRSLFGVGQPGLLTLDEEASGIIDAESILGEGWLLLNVQAHYNISGELVQGGQLLAIQIPTPGAGALVALGGLFVSRRRRGA